jgi:hypothetical protein
MARIWGSPHSVNSCLNSNLGIIHVTSNVGQDLARVRMCIDTEKQDNNSSLTFAFNPSLHMSSQSRRDCSEAAGLVNSICADGK